MPKRMKTYIVRSDISDQVDCCSLRDVVEFLTGLTKEAGEEAVLKVDTGSDYDDPYTQIRVEAKRLETDEEQAVRERGEEATRQRIEAAERVQLQRLRAKYGDAT